LAIDCALNARAIQDNTPGGGGARSDEVGKSRGIIETRRRSLRRVVRVPLVAVPLGSSIRWEATKSWSSPDATDGLV